MKYTFSNISFNVTNLVRNFILIFLSIFFRDLNIEEKEKNNDCINHTVDREQISLQAERILGKYGNAILRLAYSYIHNMSDAEDILQETIIQYIKINPNFENHIHEKAWLMRVAINISKNKVIYNKKRETLEIDENLFIKEEKELEFVWDAIKNLPLKYREVIHMFYHEGYSTAQIAEMLSKNEATIRSLLHRGRKKLKGILREVYDFDE